MANQCAEMTEQSDQAEFWRSCRIRFKEANWPRYALWLVTMLSLGISIYMGVKGRQKLWGVLDYQTSVFVFVLSLALSLIEFASRRALARIERSFNMYGHACPALASIVPPKNPKSACHSVDALLQKHGIIRLSEAHYDLSQCSSGRIRLRSDADVRRFIQSVSGWLAPDSEVNLYVLLSNWDIGSYDTPRWLAQSRLLDYLEGPGSAASSHLAALPSDLRERCTVNFVSDTDDLRSNSFLTGYGERLCRILPRSRKRFIRWTETHRYVGASPQTMSLSESTAIGSLWWHFRGKDKTIHERGHDIFVCWCGPLSGYPVEDIAAALDCDQIAFKRLTEAQREYTESSAIVIDTDHYAAHAPACLVQLEDIKDVMPDKVENFTTADVLKELRKRHDRTALMLFSLAEIWPQSERIMAIDTTMTNNSMELWKANLLYLRIGELTEQAARDYSKPVCRIFIHKYDLGAPLPEAKLAAVKRILLDHSGYGAQVILVSKETVGTFITENGLADESIKDCNIAVDSNGRIEGWFLQEPTKPDTLFRFEDQNLMKIQVKLFDDLVTFCKSRSFIWDTPLPHRDSSEMVKKFTRAVADYFEHSFYSQNGENS